MTYTPTDGAPFYLAVQIQALPSRVMLKNFLVGRWRSADTGITARWRFTGHIRGVNRD